MHLLFTVGEYCSGKNKSAIGALSPYAEHLVSVDGA